MILRIEFSLSTRRCLHESMSGDSMVKYLSVTLFNRAKSMRWQTDSRIKSSCWPQDMRCVPGFVQRPTRKGAAEHKGLEYSVQWMSMSHDLGSWLRAKRNRSIPQRARTLGRV